MRKFVVEISELSADGERKGHNPCGYFECDEGDLETADTRDELATVLMQELSAILRGKK